MPGSVQRPAYDAPTLELPSVQESCNLETRYPDTGPSRQRAIADADWLEETQVLDVTRRHDGVRKGKRMFLVCGTRNVVLGQMAGERLHWGEWRS